MSGQFTSVSVSVILHPLNLSVSLEGLRSDYGGYLVNINIIECGAELLQLQAPSQWQEGGRDLLIKVHNTCT